MHPISPDQIDLALLPSVLFESKHELPACAAVYFVLSAEQEVLYIGRTISLQRRWAGHHRLEAYRSRPEVKIAWLLVTDEAFLSALEAACIAYFEPKDNQRPGHSHSGPVARNGPVPHGYVRGQIVLQPDLLEWAKNQPEGLSGLVRQLLQAERQRREPR